MRVKLAWLVRVGDARPPPFTTFTITSKVAVYAPAEWADTLTLFHLYQYMYSVLVPVPILSGIRGFTRGPNVSPALDQTRLDKMISGVTKVLDQP
jgi:hypothetical protein